ncbi:hypothetical protein P3T37_004036 [Kitasatospora sp. MAA4]|uniref:hypothetical protein n=1 Tax=Kitasatospora sp. MAA4 TaxID=3035093 RepID=UPI002476FBEC|nr:hypothetical protein [Kitasatospora sp. MAA4]MDH6134632.1 hypothetical protein [Kitasatospora sp. MAA4]
MDQLRDYAGAAEVLDLPETWLRRNIRRIPHTKFGKHVRFSDDHLRVIRAMHEVLPARPLPAITAGPASLVPRGAR